MHFKNILFAACLGAALIGATGAAHAGTSFAGAGATVVFTQSDTESNQSTGGTASASAGIAREWDTGFAEGKANAIAGDGFVKGYAETSASGQTDDHRSGGSGGANASFKEMLTFSSAAHTGMPGQVTVAAIFDALVQADGSAQASSEFMLAVGPSSGVHFVLSEIDELGDSFDSSVSRLSVSDVFGFRELPYAGVATLTFDITWGDTVLLSMQLGAVGRTLNAVQISSSAWADAFHSGYWGGVVSATAGGVAIDDFSVLSATGLDYRNSFAVAAPVPEPETVALLAVGLLAVWGRVRRARRAGVA